MSMCWRRHIVEKWNRLLIDRQILLNLLGQSDLSRVDKLLVCLADQENVARPVKEIRSVALDAGLRQVAKWNISSILSRSSGLAVRSTRGWEITSKGRTRVMEIIGNNNKSRQPMILSKMHDCLPAIKDPTTLAFVEEAVSCAECGLYRSAVVLSWVGAVALLQDYVFSRHWDTFRNAVQKEKRLKDITSKNDLTYMHERDFINMLVDHSILDRNVARELQICRELRNACGHPNQLEIGELRIASHLEVLVKNVFTKFS